MKYSRQGFCDCSDKEKLRIVKEERMKSMERFTECHAGVPVILDKGEERRVAAAKRFAELEELATPKKPIYEGDGYAPDGTFIWDEWLCPNCGSTYEVDYDKYDHCPNCGQKIDWSE